MEFRTIVDVPKPDFEIGPCEEMLFVGSCFATEIGRRFQEEKFRAVVNPYGVMYNPASILHTIERWTTQGDRNHVRSNRTEFLSPCVAFLTLGTNHVYRLKETGEIVDNCQKRPSPLFTEEELSVDECADYLMKAVELLRQKNPDIHIVLTVSPIRYRKYGYHGSQLSKATLLLAVEKVIRDLNNPSQSSLTMVASLAYFPAYEIINDELRDYRFYKEDMLHPSDQAVEYIWQRLSEVYLSDEAKSFLREWAPLKAVLNHKPFEPDSEEYKALLAKTMLKVEALSEKYPNFALE
ncbi:MAG: GSCFA domain-containing protein [Prevotella sp.]|nr:GSCFA domain-containing protein [Prevotella sp.]